MITVLGKGLVTLKQVRAVPLRQPPRKPGAYWQGVPHGELVGAILDECAGRHWKVTETKFCLSKDGADLAAALSLDVPDLEMPAGQRLGLGILTSNAMRRALRIVVGTTVLICQNGMVSGELVLTRKHTVGFDIHRDIVDALDDYLTKARAIPNMVEGLQARKLKPSEAEHILMEAGRLGIMPGSRIFKVDEEYRNPRFPEFYEPTSWSLLNAFTWVVKENPALEQMDQINCFRELLPTEQLIAA